MELLISRPTAETSGLGSCLDSASHGLRVLHVEPRLASAPKKCGAEGHHVGGVPFEAKTTHRPARKWIQVWLHNGGVSSLEVPPHRWVSLLVWLQKKRKGGTLEKRHPQIMLSRNRLSFLLCTHFLITSCLAYQPKPTLCAHMFKDVHHSLASQFVRISLESTIALKHNRLKDKQPLAVRRTPKH